MTKEALTQLREIHAIQGLDGCWDIDDYMLGLYNGLELSLSIVENREFRYKQRPKSQRTWAGLTNGEMIELSEMKLGSWDLILEVEDKLKEQNNV